MNYKLRNLPHRLRGWKQEVQALLGYGVCAELQAKVRHPDGRIVDLGVLGRRVVTNAGVAFMVDAFQGLADISDFNWHGSGTGVGAEDVTDTGITQVGSREDGVQTEPAANQYRTTATITYAGDAAITEHGLFSADTDGTLWDRTVFAAINVSAAMSIEFQYTLTVNAGG